MLDYEELEFEIDEEPIANSVHKSTILDFNACDELHHLAIKNKQKSNYMSCHKGHVKKSEVNNLKTELETIYTQRKRSRQDVCIKLSNLDSPNFKANKQRQSYVQSKSDCFVLETKQ